jgi:hypothetical protein
MSKQLIWDIYDSCLKSLRSAGRPVPKWGTRQIETIFLNSQPIARKELPHYD